MFQSNYCRSMILRSIIRTMSLYITSSLVGWDMVAHNTILLGKYKWYLISWIAISFIREIQKVNVCPISHKLYISYQLALGIGCSSFSSKIFCNCHDFLSIEYGAFIIFIQVSSLKRPQSLRMYIFVIWATIAKYACILLPRNAKPRILYATACLPPG